MLSEASVVEEWICVYRRIYTVPCRMISNTEDGMIWYCKEEEYKNNYDTLNRLYSENNGLVISDSVVDIEIERWYEFRFIPTLSLVTKEIYDIGERCCYQLYTGYLSPV